VCKHLCLSTTVNSVAVNSNGSLVSVQTGYTFDFALGGMLVLVAPPIMLLQPNSAMEQFNISSSILYSSYQVTGLTNGAIIGIIAASGLVIVSLLLVGYFLLQRRSRGKGERRQLTSRILSATLTPPIIVAIISGTAICILAAKPGWQDNIISRWDSPNAVLRVVQAMSFVIRLCSTIFGWACIVNIGWLMMFHGLRPAQMVRTFDMAAIGGSYG
jgi:hypothetical protein